jgi:GNAT superfamily N-acetyltransferase
MALKILIPQNESQWSECRLLHFEYIRQAGSHPILRPYFTLKNFAVEINRMPRDYQPPDGICLVAYLNNIAVGTVALRKLDDKVCEMKRLYVKAEARGAGVGTKLIEQLVLEARYLGYERIRLDNSRSAMAKANQLYRQLGFYEIDRYNENTVADAYFMEKKL